MTGLEADLKYNYSDLFFANANVSYQNAINTTKYSPNSAGNTPEATYLNKIPNQPWLFGNLDLSFSKKNIIGKDSRLQSI